ncbi:MAG TPA: zinc metallopeptidase [Thiolapillus brandeum]|uniref:Zinc metallopeptidase n=1 Tax=Thiolapillus brandeum TaxID=1076588 RepID=A0A831WEB8_9GAMM|nr:zinc metallopeptidase [Thiolapillus brandeum]
MVYLILILLLLAVIYGPQWWVQRVLDRYNRHPETNFPGTASELARHLLNGFGLDHVRVEATDKGDHYDPAARSVRLTPDKFNGRTLTAITVAAHEVGHALQHHAGEPLFAWRSRLVMATLWGQRLGSFLLFATPMLIALTRVPAVGFISFIGAFLLMGMGVMVQFITIPVEMDASFNRALPLLKNGYLEKSQYAAAKQILRAAALTYVAASLAGLLNFWRWMQVLRK